MSAIYVSTDLYSHPITWDTSTEALGVWTVGLLDANNNRDWDWVLPPDYLKQVGARKSIADQLLTAGLWSLHVWGYEIEQYVRGDRLWRPGPSGKHRLAIPQAMRRAIYERDGYACLACGSTAPLSLDHIVHFSVGGPDTMSNLRTLCRSCNSSRRTKTDEEWGRL